MGPYGKLARQAFSQHNYLLGAGYTLAGTAFGVGNALMFGQGAGVVKLGTSSITAIGEISAAKGVQAGEAGAFGALKGVTGDGLSAHHIPQAAAGRTGYNEGGALVMTHEEHVLTRTYGSKGSGTLQSDAGLSFRDVLARDFRDVRSIVGNKYNEGLRSLADYYRQAFPEVMGR